MFNLRLAVGAMALSLAAVSLFQYQRIQRQQLVIGMADKRIAVLEGGLARLAGQEATIRASIEKLLTEQDQIRQEQAEHQYAFTRLQNEYATVRDWSDVLLPVELTSLLDRAVQTGYDGIGAAVRAGHAVPEAAGAAPKER